MLGMSYQTGLVGRKERIRICFLESYEVYNRKGVGKKQRILV
ncbi:hypothetical protein Goarm_016945 [Gossypium armourianum]|uniref:Uncharacterized protein n=1 Tax=Gossypium armourianum TaxID=34283 RepID=A0A7J9JDV5_9ROSI|nr:hypothetical protein [Gossypium armourianum]